MDGIDPFGVGGGDDADQMFGGMGDFSESNLGGAAGGAGGGGNNAHSNDNTQHGRDVLRGGAGGQSGGAGGAGGNNASANVGVGVGGLLANSGMMLLGTGASQNTARRRPRQNIGSSGSFEFLTEPPRLNVKALFPNSDELAAPHVCSVIADVRLLSLLYPNQQQNNNNNDDNINTNNQDDLVPLSSSTTGQPQPQPLLGAEVDEVDLDATNQSNQRQQQNNNTNQQQQQQAILVPKIIDLIKFATRVRNVEVHPTRKTAVVRLRDPKCAASIRMGGVITITGCNNVVSAKRAATIVCKLIRRAMGWPFDELHSAIFTINSTTVRFDLKHPIKIEALATKYPQECSYEPESYCGCTVRLKGILSVGSGHQNQNQQQRRDDNNNNENMDDDNNDNTNDNNNDANNNQQQSSNKNNKRWAVVASVYASGKVVMLGACSAREAMAAYNGLLPKLHEFAGFPVVPTVRRGNDDDISEDGAVKAAQQQQQNSLNDEDFPPTNDLGEEEDDDDAVTF